MSGAPLSLFTKGDLVRVKHRGRVMPGVWVFGSADDEIVTVRRQGYASPRYLAVSEVELIDHDARWPS